MVWVVVPRKGEFKMPNGMTAEYEIHDGWWTGQLREHPNVLSQGRSKAELIHMLLDAEALLDQRD